MTRSIPMLGYASKSAAAVALRRKGLKHREIAAALGVATSTVGNLLKHGRHSTQATDPAAYRTERLSKRQRSRLQQAARRRGMPLRSFVDLLLATVVDEQLVDAILDDRSTEE